MKDYTSDEEVIQQGHELRQLQLQLELEPVQQDL